MNINNVLSISIYKKMDIKIILYYNKKTTIRWINANNNHIPSKVKW